MLHVKVSWSLTKVFSIIFFAAVLRNTYTCRSFSLNLRWIAVSGPFQYLQICLPKIESSFKYVESEFISFKKESNYFKIWILILISIFQEFFYMTKVVCARNVRIECNIKPKNLPQISGCRLGVGSCSWIFSPCFQVETFDLGSQVISSRIPVITKCDRSYRMWQLKIDS